MTVDALYAARTTTSKFDSLDEGALLVLLLAFERTCGRKSAYAPFIASLPANAPCPWAWPEDEVRVAAQDFVGRVEGQSDTDWSAEVSRARAYVGQVSEGLFKDFAEHIGVELHDLQWALGIVTSRGYGGDLKPSLIPFIDLFNHHSEALPFQSQMLQVASADGNGEEDTQFFTVWASWKDMPRCLEIGDELYVDYLMHDMTPLEAFVCHGFVPTEKLQK
mmetsp:Transcript_30028/g.75662  ORF Transcript_30028/g.75662 Transcript_30028/m.75662 type:complete len:220 (+) Transcript_30028:655-1314(+)